MTKQEADRMCSKATQAAVRQQAEYNARWSRNRDERDALIEEVRDRIRGKSLRIRIEGMICIVRIWWKYRKIVED